MLRLIWGEVLFYNFPYTFHYFHCIETQALFLMAGFPVKIKYYEKLF